MSTIQEFEAAAAKATQASAQADTWANGPINTTVPTDSGPVPTIAEFIRANQERADDAIESLGWVLAGDFTAGCTVTDRNQYVLVVGGAGYRWDGVLPKVVAPGSSPTPIATGSWVLVGDVTLRGDLANTYGSELVGFLQSGTGTVARTAESKLREIVSVKDFGAAGDGITDDAVAIQSAINAVVAAGGGKVFFPAGTYMLGDALDFGSNVTLEGVGAGSVLRPMSTSLVPMIRHVGTSGAVLTDVTISKLALRGRWDELQSEGGSNGLITVTYVHRLTIENCILSYSRFFGMNINNCDDVKVMGNSLRYMPRDMIGVWNTPNALIGYNTLLGNDDDGISVSTASPYTAPIRSGVIVFGNSLTDTGPIRAVGARGIQVIGNRICRSKGQGIAIFQHPGDTNLSSTHSIVIADNLINDVIDRMYFLDGSVSTTALKTYIFVDSANWSNGGSGAIPGEPDGSGVVAEPYSDYYTTSGPSNADQVRASSGVLVKGNVCKRTLPAVAAYSDWGFGQAYTKNGFFNTPVLESHIRGRGIALRIPLESALIESNILEAGAHGIGIELAENVTPADRLIRGVVIRGNVIRDALNSGIYAPLPALKHQDLTIEDNFIDCDPLFQSSNRGVNGTWITQAQPVALELTNHGGVVVSRNTIRNASQAIVQAGASAVQQIEFNTVFADAAASGFSTSNKGIGTIPGIGDGSQWWLQSEDSDPASTTYKNSLGANLRNYSLLPTNGKWLAGTFIRSRSSAVSGTAGSRYVLLGWVRTTTGTGNVLNTDWIELRCLTGT